MPCSPSLPEVLQSRSVLFGGLGQSWGDERRTVDLFTLGRQEAVLGTAQDSDGSRKRPGDWEGTRVS